jgi:putative peptidoglycan lipid II flippase
MSHIAKSSLIIAVFFAVDKVLGFIRQLFVARQFGLTYEIDVFNAANNIPDLLSALISGGALGVALIPVLSEYLETRGRQDTWELFARILNLAFLVTGAISVLIAIFAQPLVSNVIAPGFPPEQQALTVELMRLDLFAIMIFSISGLVMAGLQANQHFLLPAMAPGLYNIGQIFGVAVLAPSQGLSIGPVTLPAFGLGIHGLVFGVIIGALLHLGIQIPGLIRYKFRWIPAINLRNPGVQQVLALLGPRVLTMFFLQVFFITRDNLASGLGEGAVTALNYGWFIMQVPETLIGSALAIALLPTISELFARRQIGEYAMTINNAVRVVLAFTLPIAALMWVALAPLIPVVFGFDPEGSELVLWVTRAYLIGLTGHALLEIGARSFYAHQDARTPLYVAALNAGAYLLFAITLSRSIGPAGIALANTIAFTGEAVLLLLLLRRKLPRLAAQADPARTAPIQGVLLKMNGTLLRAVIASVTGALVATLILRLPMHPLLLGIGALGAGGLTVLPFIWPEIKILIKL